MNAVEKALDNVRFCIPREILHEVFIRRTQDFRSHPTDIDHEIRERVIRPTVFVDCNLVGGTEVYIDLSRVSMERISNFISVYKIPKSVTQGRSIISVKNITFADPNASTSYMPTTNCQATPLLTTAQGMMDALGQIPITSSAHCQLVGENTVMVRDTVLVPASAYLRCVLANDETMSHLQLRSYRHFVKLVELAVKAFIYNEMIIQMDVGQLYGGQNLGRFKEVIDGWSDAYEMYNDYLREKFTKVSLMNDNEQFTRFTRLIVSGR